MFTPLNSIKKLISGRRSTADDISDSPVRIQTKESDKTNAASVLVERDSILTNQNVSSRLEVLQLISRKMQEKGYVQADYTEALEARENAVSTYLINGVAIPHGVNEAKAMVAKTGIVIVQLPGGVSWNDKGDKVHLAVGIAAAGKEHLDLLQKLSGVVMNAELAGHLGAKATADEIAAAIGQSLPVVESKETLQDYDAEANCTIIDADGLHARPASDLVRMVKQFVGTEIWIRNGDRTVSACSMTKLLSLGATKNTELTLYAKGEQAQEAVTQLADAINKGLDAEVEEQNSTSEYKAVEELAELENPDGRQLLKGIPASPGIALAPAFILGAPEKHAIQETADQPGDQQGLLQNALKEAATQLEALQADVASASPVEAAIFQAQIELLQDSSILSAVAERIEQGCSAAWSWQQALEEQAVQLESSDSERIQARAADMRDVANRVINILQGTNSEIIWPNEDFVLISRELTPSQTAQLHEKPVKAICTALGGATSHMAILARALGIPALVGVGTDLLKTVHENEVLAVIPQSGLLIMSPDTRSIEQVETRLSQWQAIQVSEQASRHEPAITLDGTELEVVCNIASAQDAAKVLPNGACGVGLLRTEFLFESAENEPTVDEQVQALTEIVKPLGNNKLIIRTSDIGGDKPVTWLRQPKEDNPFLGVRGIRLSLRHPEVFKRQLLAIYRVAKTQQEDLGETGIHIMFPMISALSEWHQARDIANEVRQSINAPEVPLGIMIEIPAAALLADHFAREVDFFSIGTNDLTQYTLAMDRLNPELSNPLDNYNPALLQMIAMTVRAATAQGKWVGVCGNIVAEPDLARILIGLGVKELSVSPVNVPAVKQLVRSVDYSKLQSVVERALKAGKPDDVKSIIRELYH